MTDDVKHAWGELEREAVRLAGVTLRELFAREPDRFAALSFALDDLTIDISKESIDVAALDALVQLAQAADVEAKRDAMFAGEAWNLTEGRAVLHMALRGGADAPSGEDPKPELERFLAYAETVRRSKITDVINIGIGGSDLGPAMLARALAPDCDGPRLHYVANVDGADFADVTAALNPATTLVIVASKTFTTLETMANAELAKAWLNGRGEMAAVSTNLAGCAAFGIPAERVFRFHDWVGGRYSVWSAIGLSVAIGIGAEKFRAFLDGAAAMDSHFRTAPLGENLPVLLALVGIWRRNVMGWPTVALIPYDQRLARFPAYVQQLDMESNGKRVARDGEPVSINTGPVIWGEPGTNAQHSFFQLLHQGTDVVPVDFIAAANPRNADPGQHELLLANMLAQGTALAFGRREDEVRAEMTAAGADADTIAKLAPHRTFPGDRPSTTILYRELSPYALGRLIALYEHKVFVQGAIWNINSFDQWGVELGKELAKSLLPAVRGAAHGDLDPSTAGLLARLQDLRS